MPNEFTISSPVSPKIELALYAQQEYVAFTQGVYQTLKEKENDETA